MLQYVIVTSTVAAGGCDITTAGLTTGCVTLYAPGPGVIKFGAGKRFVFMRKEI